MAYFFVSNSGWFAKYLRFSLLHLIYIGAFYFPLTGAWPAPLTTAPYRGGPIEVVYMVDTDNHLVQHFLNTECRVVQKQNIRRGESDRIESEVLLFSTESDMGSLSHRARNYIYGDGGALIAKVKCGQISPQYLSPPEETKKERLFSSEDKFLNTESLPLLEQTARGDKYEDSDTKKLSMVGIGSHTTLTGYNTGEGAYLFNTENNLDQQKVFRRGEVERTLVLENGNHMVLERDEGILEEAKTTLALKSHVPLWPITNGTKAEKENWAKDVAKYEDDSLSKAWDEVLERLEAQTTTIILVSQPEPYKDPTTQRSDMYSTVSDLNDNYIASYSVTAVIQAIQSELGDITTGTYIWGVDIPTVVQHTTTIETTEVVEQTQNKGLISSSPENSTVASNGTLNLPYNYSSVFPKNFGNVVGIATGLGFLMAIPSLFLLCVLSRRGQYIWVRSVNFSGAQSPVTRRIYYDGEPNAMHGADASGGGSSRDNEGASGLEINPTHDTSSIDGLVIAPRQDIEDVARLETVSNLESQGRAGISSTHNTENINRPEIELRRDIENANRLGTVSRERTNRSGHFQKLFGHSNMKEKGIFKRLFGSGSAKRTNFEEKTPHTSIGQGRKINSVRARNMDRIPDASLILTEVTERLIRERMRQLSAPSNTAQARDRLPSISSTRAVTTGSAMGTQRQNSTIKRSRKGIPESIDNIGGVEISDGCNIADGNNSAREESQEDMLDSGEGDDSRGKAPRSVRFDDSADKGKEKVKGTIGRASIKQYLSPTVENDKSSMEDEPLSRDNFELSSGTVVRKERAGVRMNGLWGDMFGDPAVASEDPRISGGIGAEIGGRPEEDPGFEGFSSGSSIGDDSTLTLNSDKNIQPMVDSGQLPIGEGYRLGFCGGLVANQLMTRSTVYVPAQGITSDDCGVSAFGVTTNPTKWDSDDSRLSSGYFSGSSGNGRAESEVDLDIPVLVDHKEDAAAECEETMGGGQYWRPK